MINFSFKSSTRQAAGVTAIVSVLGLAACDEQFAIAPGAVDTNDSCSQFQQGIVEARREANNLRVQNIVAGAAVGAILGAALGGEDNREQGAILGAVLGAGIAGAATAEQQQNQRQADAAVLRDVNAQAGSANQLLTNAGRSAASLRSCRRGQIVALERAVRENRIAIPAARSQLAVLKRRANADDQIISASFNGIGGRVDDFVQTGAQSSGVDSAIFTRQAAARTAEQRAVRAATPNVARAKSTQVQLANADVQQRQSIDRSFGAIDVLLAG